MAEKIYWAIIDEDSREITGFISGDVGGLPVGGFDADTWIEIDVSLVGVYQQNNRWRYESGVWVDTTTYVDLRAEAYPSVEDQLDYIYHNGVEAWKIDVIEPIKASLPAPQY